MNSGMIFAVAVSLSVLAPAAAAEDTQEVARFKATASAVGRVRDLMRDPDSIVFERITTTRDAQVICIAYRSRNGFGGMEREGIAFLNGRLVRNSEIYAGPCKEAVLDMTYVGELANATKR
jgi:hypothetical protein